MSRSRRRREPEWRDVSIRRRPGRRPGRPPV